MLSTIFFACHSSWVISEMSPCLYRWISVLACCRPSDETSSVRGSEMSIDCRTRPQYVERSYSDAGRSRWPDMEEVMLLVTLLLAKHTGRGSGSVLGGSSIQWLRRAVTLHKRHWPELPELRARLIYSIYSPKLDEFSGL